MRKGLNSNCWEGLHRKRQPRPPLDEVAQMFDKHPSINRINFDQLPRDQTQIWFKEAHDLVDGLLKELATGSMQREKSGVNMGHKTMFPSLTYRWGSFLPPLYFLPLLFRPLLEDDIMSNRRCAVLIWHCCLCKWQCYLLALLLINWQCHLISGSAVGFSYIKG